MRVLLLLPVAFAAAVPAAAQNPTYGYCWMEPKLRFFSSSNPGARVEKDTTRFVSGVLETSGSAASVWQQFREFVIAKGLASEYLGNCFNHYRTRAEVEKYLDNVIPSKSVVKTGWSNLTNKAAVAPPKPLAPRPSSPHGSVVFAPPVVRGAAVPGATDRAREQAEADRQTAARLYRQQHDRDRAREASAQAERDRIAKLDAQARASYRAKVAQWDADNARREAEAARARAEWETQVARCKAGDRKACAGKAVSR